MPVGILNNIAGLTAENQLNITNTSLQSVLFQLSSGSRINSAPMMLPAWPSPTACRRTSAP